MEAGERDVGSAGENFAALFGATSPEAKAGANHLAVAFHMLRSMGKKK